MDTNPEAQKKDNFKSVDAMCKWGKSNLKYKKAYLQTITQLKISLSRPEKVAAYAPKSDYLSI